MRKTIRCDQIKGKGGDQVEEGLQVVGIKRRKEKEQEIGEQETEADNLSNRERKGEGEGERK